MFLTNIKRSEQAVYNEAAQRCGLTLSFTNVSKEKTGSIEQHELKDYLSVFTPDWCQTRSITFFRSILDSVKAEKTGSGPTQIRISQAILDDFAAACDHLYDPNEENEPVDHEVWHQYFRNFTNDPKVAVELFRADQTSFKLSNEEFDALLMRLSQQPQVKPELKQLAERVKNSKWKVIETAEAVA